MARLSDLAGSAGILLALVASLCALAAVLPPIRSLSGRARTRALWGVTGAGVLIGCLPINGLPLTAYVRGVTDDLSLTSLMLLAGWWWRTQGERPAPTARERLTLRLLILVGAATLYPMALGATPIDSYRWGFADPWLLGVLALIAALALGAGLRRVPLAIGLAVLAYGLGLYESRNLWNYLLDPLVALHALLMLIGNALARLWSAASAMVRPTRQAPP